MLFAFRIAFRSICMKHFTLVNALQSRRYTGILVDPMFAFADLSIYPDGCAETWERTSCSIPTTSASLVVWTTLEAGLIIGMLPAEQVARRWRVFSGSAESFALPNSIQSAGRYRSSL